MIAFINVLIMWVKIVLSTLNVPSKARLYLVYFDKFSNQQILDHPIKI